MLFIHWSFAVLVQEAGVQEFVEGLEWLDAACRM